MLKTCNKCNKTKELKEFYFRNNSHKYRSQCKECEQSKAKKYRLANPIKNKEWKLINKARVQNHNKNYWNKNKNNQKLLCKRKTYLEQNKEQIRKSQREYMRKRLKEDPKFRLDMNFGNAIYKSIKNKNYSKWQALISYNLNGLMRHLEKHFSPEMNWNNYGSYWEIDHIIPKSVFNYTKFEHIDFARCWSLKNLRPLVKKVNRAKRNKLDSIFQPSLNL